MQGEINPSSPFDFIDGSHERPKKVRKEEVPLGSFLFEESKTWQRAMAGYHTGQILGDLGVISSEQMEEASRWQQALQENGGSKSLGILLIELGYTNSQAYLDALSRYFGIPIVSLRNYIPNPSLKGLVVYRYSYHYKFIVFENCEGQIKLVLGEPNPLIMDELKKTFGCKKKIEFYLSNPFEVESCFRRFLDPFSRNFYR